MDALTHGQGSSSLMHEVNPDGGSATDDLWFVPDDTYYIGYDSTDGVCGRPRQINVTRRIDLGGTANEYDPILNLLVSGSCTVPVIRGWLEGHFWSNVNGVDLPVELYGGAPLLANAGYPVLIRSDKTLNTDPLDGAVILAGYEAVASAESETDKIVEVCLEDGDGNDLTTLQYFAGNKQLIARGLRGEVTAMTDLVGYGAVPSASYQGNSERAGLEIFDDTSNNPSTLTLWGKRDSDAYGAGSQDGLNCEILADINAAAIDADHVVLGLRWRDNVDADTDLFYFKDSEMEIVSAAQAAVLGTSADGAAAVGVQIGAENDFVTAGARLVEFVNDETEVRGFVDYLGDLGFSMLDNGQQVTIQTLTELTTIAAAASTSTAIQIPAKSLVFAVSVRVTTVIPTSTDFDVGVAGAVNRYGDALAVAAGTTNAGTEDAFRYYDVATAILLTMNGGNPAANTGRVRVTIHYITVTPPTS